MFNFLRPGPTWPTKVAIWSLLTGVIVLTSGCRDFLTAIALQTAPTTEKVDAEFNRLPGKTVLVYVWAPPEIQWAYPKVRLDLAAFLSAYLQRHVDNVTTVDYYRVEAFLEKQSAHQMPKIESRLADEFNADIVVHISVYQLTMHDPGLSQFYRGRLSASVMVHDFSQPDEPERIPLKDVEVAFPDEGPVGLANVSAADVRRSTYYVFTEKVGRKFHEYERGVDFRD